MQVYVDPINLQDGTIRVQARDASGVLGWHDRSATSVIIALARLGRP